MANEFTTVRLADDGSKAVAVTVDGESGEIKKVDAAKVPRSTKEPAMVGDDKATYAYDT